MNTTDEHITDETSEYGKTYSYDAADETYGKTYMEKARGMILLAISEMNTTRKGLNAITNTFRTNESTGDNAKGLRGAAYIAALRDIITTFENSPEKLGDYSVSSNFFGFSQKAFGGRRKRKSAKKTHKKK